MKSSTFVAAGLDGFIATSRDGKNWKEKKGNEGDTYKYICFGNGTCLVGGSRGQKAIFSVSNNGSSWNQTRGDYGYEKSPKAVFYYDGKFYATGGDAVNLAKTKPYVIESNNGRDWSKPKTVSGNRLLKRFAVGDKVIVGVGDFGRKSALKSPYSWEDMKGYKAVNTLIDIAYGNGVFVGAGLHGMRMSSKDGLNWSKPEMGEEGEHINAIFFDGKQFVGVGLGATYFSPNGKTWKRVRNGDAPYLVSYGNGLYIGAKWKGKIFASKDAVKWQQVANLGGAVSTIKAGSLG